MWFEIVDKGRGKNVMTEGDRAILTALRYESEKKTNGNGMGGS
jgi:hypothetical protein